MILSAETSKKYSGLIVFVVIVFQSSVGEAKTYTSPTEHYTVTYPDSWHLDLTEVTMSNLVVVRNCPRTDFPGGASRPAGMAQIALHPLPPDTNEYEFAQESLATGSNVTVSPTATPAVRITETFRILADPVEYKRITVLLRRGAKLFIVTLDHEASDTQANNYEQILDSMVSSFTIQ